MFEYVASPTGNAFLTSRAFIKIVMGPVGGGKSTVALMDLLERAVGQVPFNRVRRTKFIILRNTIAQLKSTVKPLIDQWFTTLISSNMGQWRLTDNVFECRFKLGDGTVVHTEFAMMAADSPEDVRRLLSVECSAAWVEEGREVDSEVFSGLQGRTARFPNRASGGVTYPGVIVSTNPPPLGGFWHGMISNPPKNTEVFLQPSAMLEDGSLNPEAENLEHLDPMYYENLISGKTVSWIDVYIKNQYGPGEYGNPVYRSTFKHSFHVAKVGLKPVPQSLYPLIVGMDNGLQAAAVIGQQDMRGRVNVLNECYVPKDETMGVETFLSRMLVPLLRAEYPGFKPENTLFVLDPACFARSQIDEKTIAASVAAYGFKVSKAVSNDPERRIGAVEGLLSRQIDGAAGFLIDPRCQYLTNGFEWGYRNKKTASGSGTMVPDKNHFSHLHDACQYFSMHFNAATSGLQTRRQAMAVKRAAYAYS